MINILNPNKTKLFIAIAIVMIVISLIIYLSTFLMIDNCLDSGGRWNYDKRYCEINEQQKQENDIIAICQLVIDYPQFQWIFHPEIPDRVPLLVSDKIIGRDITLFKFDQAVIVQTDTLLKDEAFLRFLLIDISNHTATVKFEYPLEGAIASANLIESYGDSWKIIEATIIEK